MTPQKCQRLCLHLSIVLLSLIAPFMRCEINRQLLKDIEVLSSDKMEGRRTGSKGNLLARNYLTHRLGQIGIQPFFGDGLVGYGQPFSYFFNNGTEQLGPIPGVNLVSFVPGKVGQNVIVISAHYDHLGVFKGKIFNGADDNASGSAGLLQLAEYFTRNQPQNAMMFILFDAEEGHFDRKNGFWISPLIHGSRFFVDNPPLPLDMIKLNINIDMISHSDKSELYALVVNPTNSTLGPFLRDDAGKVRMIVHPKSQWPMSSDSDQFAAKGIPYVYFSVEAHKDYHQTSDIYENINHTFVGDTVQAILGITRKLDAALAGGFKF